MKQIVLISNHNGKSHTVPASENEVIESMLLNGWHLKTMRAAKHIQTTLFADTTDDWGDAREQRLGQRRLL